MRISKQSYHWLHHDLFQTKSFINDVVSNSFSFTSDCKLKTFLYSRIIVLKISDRIYFLNSEKKAEVNFQCKRFSHRSYRFSCYPYYRRKEEVGNGSDCAPILHVSMVYSGHFYQEFEGRVQFAARVIFLFILFSFLPSIGNRGIGAQRKT